MNEKLMRSFKLGPRSKDSVRTLEEMTTISSDDIELLLENNISISFYNFYESHQHMHFFHTISTLDEYPKCKHLNNEAYFDTRYTDEQISEINAALAVLKENSIQMNQHKGVEIQTSISYHKEQYLSCEAKLKEIQKDLNNTRQELQQLMSFSSYSKNENLILNKQKDIDKLLYQLQEERQNLTRIKAHLLKDCRFYIDMDGVLAKYSPVESFDVLFNEGYFRSLEPQEEVVSGIKNLIENYPGQVYILSSVIDSQNAKLEKLDWLKEFLPELSEESILFNEYGHAKSKLVEGISSTDILIDDYNYNLDEWRQSGGTAIKLVNQINDQNQSFKGNRIYYTDTNLFKSLEEAVFESTVIQDGNLQSTQVNGDLHIKVDYQRQTPREVKKTLVDLVERLETIGDSHQYPRVLLSVSVKDNEVLVSEPLSKNYLNTRFKAIEKDENAFLNVAGDILKARIIGDVLEDGEFDKTIAELSKVISFKDELKYQMDGPIEEIEVGELIQVGGVSL